MDLKLHNSLFCTYVGVEDLLKKKSSSKCLLVSMELFTDSENSFSNPFQRPNMGDFDGVQIHTEFGGGFLSNTFLINRLFH